MAMRAFCCRLIYGKAELSPNEGICVSILLAFALQAASAPSVAELQQKADAANQQASNCFQEIANRWWMLSDDARSIADGALYLCEAMIDREAIAFQNWLLARLMSERSSTQGWEQAVAEHKRALRDRLRTGAVAVVLDKRFKSRAEK